MQPSPTEARYTGASEAQVPPCDTARTGKSSTWYTESEGWAAAGERLMEAHQPLSRLTSHDIAITTGHRSVLKVSADALIRICHVTYHILMVFRIHGSALEKKKISPTLLVSWGALTWDDVCQGPQCRLNLTHRACILGDKVLINGKPFRRLQKRRGYWTLKISDGLHVRAQERWR